jgi:hypothetical protein
MARREARSKDGDHLSPPPSQPLHQPLRQLTGPVDRGGPHPPGALLPRNPILRSQQPEPRTGSPVQGNDDVLELRLSLHRIRPGDRRRGTSPPKVRMGDAQRSPRSHVYRFCSDLLSSQRPHSRPMKIDACGSPK